jgi:outer membrane cobalamin receptor
VQSRALTAAVAMIATSVAAEERVPESGPPPVRDELVVVGVRGGVFEQVPAASTDVLYTDDYSAEAKTLADLLDASEGVTVRRFGGAGDRAEVSIRGSTPSQVVVAIDGVRANSALTGGLDLSRVCLPLVESIEITRGAGSTQQGGGAIGGVVNVVTRTASFEPTTRAALRAGAFETYEGSLLHAASLGPLDYSVGYCGFDTEGDFDFVQPREEGDGFTVGFEPEDATRQNNDRQRHAASLALGTELGLGTVSLTDYFVYSDGGEPGFDGGNGSTAGQDLEAHSRDLSNLAQLRWEGPPPKGLGEDLHVAAWHRFEREEFEDPSVPFGEPIDLRARLQSAGARVRDVFRFAPFAQSLSIGLQLDAVHDRLDASDQRDRRRETWAGAVDPALRLFDERVIATAGLRVERTEGFDTEWLPSGGLVLVPFPWLRARGQIGRAYRAPNFDELFHPDEGFIVGNADLAPEDAWNADVGIELLLAELGPLSMVRLGATGFRREIDDSIVWLLVSPDTLRPENTGSATSEGLELTGSFQLTRYLRATASHTLLDSERDATGRRLPGQPDDETHVRLQLGPETLWKLVGEMEHTGEILVNEGGSRRLPRRTVWNASAALNLAALPGTGLGGLVTELWIHARIDNIDDTAVRDSLAFPQPGRNASAGIEVRW